MPQIRGFACLDPEERRKVASSGGRAAHAKGVAHTWTPEQAREAGRLGGIAGGKKRKQTSEAFKRVGAVTSTSSFTPGDSPF